MSSPIAEHKKKTISREHFNAIVLGLLHQKNYRDAAALMWPHFKQNEWTDKIWTAIEKYPRLCIMGHGSASKTYTASIWFLLDWLAHAEETALILTSATVGSMDARIWADFKSLWTKSRYRLDQTAQIMDSKRLIRQNIHEGKAAIHAVAAESDDSETKIQGMHMPRVRVIIDEADNPYSSSIWPALVNLGTSGDLKAVALANPTDKNSEFGFHCEPIDGWDSINPDLDFEWESKLGWHVLRLDGLQSPNLLAGEDKYPYLLTNNSVNETRHNKSENSPEWWTMIRAYYPPEGLSSNIFPSGLIAKCNKPILWYTTTEAIAACDPALEGGDNCVLTIGKMGRFAENPQRFGIEVENFITIKRKNVSIPISHDYGEQIVKLLVEHKVAPDHFAIDCTGNGIGISDYIKSQHGMNIHATIFGGGPTEMKMTAEDSSPPGQRFKNFVTELWYAAREWCRLGLVYVPTVSRDLRIQLEARKYELKGKDPKSGREVIQAEAKKDMKDRGLHSPDEGDAFCLLVYLVRKLTVGFTPGTFKDATKENSMKRFTKNATVWTQDYGVPEP